VVKKTEEVIPIKPPTKEVVPPTPPQAAEEPLILVRVFKVKSKDFQDLLPVMGTIKGKTEIALKYVRSWEKDVAPVKEAVFAVIIK
jgi:hypothetical protein